MTDIVYKEDESVTFLPSQRPITRTSDLTLHCLFRGGENKTMYAFSRDFPNVWTNQTLWAGTYSASLYSDSEGNLFVARGGHFAGSDIVFKKATVDKSNPSNWTWSWGNDITVNAISNGKHPSILVDSNGYIHIVYARQGAAYLTWSRSIDGGDNWTHTDISIGEAISPGITKDNSDNLFVFGEAELGYYIKGVKITYSAGPSWNIGTIYSVGSGALASVEILPNQRICIDFLVSPQSVYFKKTTNPSDLSSWESEVFIYSPCSAKDDLIEVYSDTRIRVYFRDDADVSNSCYKESTNGGSSFGSKVKVTDYTTAFFASNPSLVGFRSDILWTRSSPRQIEHYRDPPILEESLSLSYYFKTEPYVLWLYDVLKLNIPEIYSLGNEEEPGIDDWFDWINPNTSHLYGEYTISKKSEVEYIKAFVSIKPGETPGGQMRGRIYKKINGVQTSQLVAVGSWIDLPVSAGFVELPFVDVSLEPGIYYIGYCTQNNSIYRLHYLNSGIATDLYWETVNPCDAPTPGNYDYTYPYIYSISIKLKEVLIPFYLKIIKGPLLEPLSLIEIAFFKRFKELFQDLTLSPEKIYKKSLKFVYENLKLGNWLGTWKYRIKLKIDSTKIDQDLNHFPIRVYLSDSSGINGDDVTAIFDEVGANKLKIAVTKADGRTQLYVEVEEWNSVNEKANLWVSRDGWTMSSTENTELYIYYDNTKSDNTDYIGEPNSVQAENVWQTSAKLVTHMKDDPDTSHIRDSTSNNNDGTKYLANEPIETDGKISKAQDFDGLDDYIILQSSDSLKITDEITVSIWMKKTGAFPTSLFYIYFPRSDATYEPLWTLKSTYAHLDFRYWGTTIAHTFRRNNILIIDNWQHIAITYSFGIGSSMKMYVNGNLVGGSWVSGNGNEALLSNKYTYAYFGRQYAWYYAFLGDEFRIYNRTLTEAEIKADYETQRDNLLSFGSQEQDVPFLNFFKKIFNSLRLEDKVYKLFNKIHFETLELLDKIVFSLKLLIFATLFLISEKQMKFLKILKESKIFVENLFSGLIPRIRKTVRILLKKIRTRWEREG